ncbi:hypothetical protein Pla163_01370 [Planctomycetes bacterium Pla163]|uniref:Uncharacterized protein n=1 Tax=Rohdeia mirabilis TaxID=2528008 RepID=A0A518CV06_9BACT|nr:hypothetical protein Pla163_01370 [Planctomycetes bacterium Pla163]
MTDLDPIAADSDRASYAETRLDGIELADSRREAPRSAEVDSPMRGDSQIDVNQGESTTVQDSFPLIGDAVVVDGVPIGQVDLDTLDFDAILTVVRQTKDRAAAIERELLSAVPVFAREHLTIDEARERFSSDPGTYIVQDPDLPWERYADIRYVDLSVNATPELRELRELSIQVSATQAYFDHQSNTMAESLENYEMPGIVEWVPIDGGATIIGYDAAGNEIGKISSDWIGKPR